MPNRPMWMIFIFVGTIVLVMWLLIYYGNGGQGF